MHGRIFISYSRQDVDKVATIARHLKEKGYSVWMDAEAIQVGDEWPEKIVRGIKQCELFVLALSPNSNSSREVRREVYLASDEKRIILPLVLPPPCKLEDGMRYHLAGLQYIEVDPPRGLQELADAIKKLITEKDHSLKLDMAFIDSLPNQKVRSLYLRPTIKAFVETMSKDVPRHLIEVLDNEQRQRYLPARLSDQQENALRRLRNHGLLEHDGRWLFTPTRSERVWASPMGELLIELGSRGILRNRQGC